MSIFDDETIRAKFESLKQNRRRLAILEKQQAQMGLPTPRHIATEIKGIHKSIQETTDELRSRRVPEKYLDGDIPERFLQTKIPIRNFVTGVLIFTCFALSVFFWFDVGSRFLARESSLKSLVADFLPIAVSGLIALVTIKRLQFVLRSTLYLRIASAIVLLLLLSSLWARTIWMPYLARASNERGVEAYLQERTQDAVEFLEQAVQFDPELVEAHYNLGVVYEDVQDYEQARQAYQLAANGGPINAHNNLARLYILDGRDAEAVLLLEQLRAAPERLDAADVLTRANIYKNLGWAYLNLDQPEKARQALREAQQIKADLWSAACLLAQVEESVGATEQIIKPLWEQCNQLAPHLPEEVEWKGQAQQYLKEHP